MKKKRWLPLLLAVLMIITAAGCGGKQEKPAASPVEKIEKPAAQAASEAAPAAAPEAAPAAAPEAAPDTAPGAPENAAGSGLTYADLAGYEFSFSSGAGAWATILNINADGSFSGNYHDSDMGSSGDGYQWTLYLCNFSGQFGKLEQINDYTYRTGITDIRYENELGTEEIVDNALYKYSAPYGLEGGKMFTFYLPDAPAASLPEDFIVWVRMAIPGIEQYWDNDAGAYRFPDGFRIGMIGLYNEETQEGFMGFPKQAPAGELTPGQGETPAQEQHASAQDVRAAVEAAETLAENLRIQLEEEDHPQLELNFLAEDEYRLWDGQLNDVWAYLKNHMDADSFSRLTDEQIAWIADKEQAVQKAGAEYEGGSIRGMIENRTAAALTKDRVYELLEYAE